MTGKNPTFIFWSLGPRFVYNKQGVSLQGNSIPRDLYHQKLVALRAPMDIIEQVDAAITMVNLASSAPQVLLRTEHVYHPRPALVAPRNAFRPIRPAPAAGYYPPMRRPLVTSGSGHIITQTPRSTSKRTCPTMSPEPEGYPMGSGHRSGGVHHPIPMRIQAARERSRKRRRATRVVRFRLQGALNAPN